MPPKPASAIKNYYDKLESIEQRGGKNEGATRDAFQSLLNEWGKPHSLVVIGEQTIESRKKSRIRLDGILIDNNRFHRGLWEAKDSSDTLEAEITKKISVGYPLDNIIFENTRQAVLFQGGQRVLSCDMRDHLRLKQLLEQFITFVPPDIEEFNKAVAKFREEIPTLAANLTDLIEEAKKKNKRFREALQSFLTLCRSSLNPDTTSAQVEDMLKQHLLTERIFRSIFQNSDFVRRNAVASELEKMVDALISQSNNRNEFLQTINHIYRPIEEKALSITDYNDKQALLNGLYEQFFQAYSTKTADTHGIVYTPAEIVRWMVTSVQKALESEFGLGLEAEGVHIIDPCVGTGTFMMEILQQIPASCLEEKYRHELHANEIQLLPYYIASQNIEHAYSERMGSYLSFEGICFADTLEIMEVPQLTMFALENSERVAKQKQAPIRVVIGNPPYNIGQENQNDNNKNRPHETVDKRIKETYAKASRATNVNKLSDVYVKFFRWATDRLGDRDGIVCFVSNNSFLEQIAFDGMRKHLLQDFTRIYTFDLGGNVRKNPKLSGTRHNVFGIQVGVTMTLLVRNQQHSTPELYYARLDEIWTKEQKLNHLTKLKDYTDVEWQLLMPDDRNTWLREGLQDDFKDLLPIGSKETKAVSGLNSESIFKTFCMGILTSRDSWVYDFNRETLVEKIKRFIETFNGEIDRYKRAGEPSDIDNFVLYDDKQIKWSRDLKSDLKRKRYAQFDQSKIRSGLFRPFTKKVYFFDSILNQDIALHPKFLPTSETEQENSVICLSGIGNNKPFHSLVTSAIPCFDLLEKTQCFPFYTYAEDGSNRQENITDFALQKYRDHYQDETITKWDIFHYVYAVLHAPAYRQKYAENLKRDLPRIPFVSAESFRAYVEAGAKLAKLHRDYEEVTPYTLKRLENRDVPLNWEVDDKGMKLSPDKISLRYNEWLTLANIPPKAFEYRLGNRSALEWVVDQYRVSTDSRSGLTHDPNDSENPKAIIKLVEQVVRVSLETVATIGNLPPLE
ncbi:MAG: N-6 DNA methylase [Chloroflexi bacterium]|nr:N-6 DNA methylase [Chloroflexota bacterium]